MSIDSSELDEIKRQLRQGKALTEILAQYPNIEFWDARIQTWNVRPPFVKQPPHYEFTEKTVCELARGGYCYIACKVLRELYPDAPIWRLTDARGENYAHVFLWVGDYALDLCGFLTIDELKSAFNDQQLVAEETTAENVRRYFGRNDSHKDQRTAERLFRAHMNRHRWFYNIERLWKSQTD